MVTIALLGTHDTKGAELHFVREKLIQFGAKVRAVDMSTLREEKKYSPDHPPSRLAGLAGRSFEELSALPKAEASEVIVEGALKLLQGWLDGGELNGAIALGGGSGAAMACAVFRGLPLGFPKVMVSTIASGDVTHYVGTRDLTMVHSVLDITLNRITRPIFAAAAGAICGMARALPVEKGADKPLVAASMYGITQPCVFSLKEILENEGFEVVIFSAGGNGARALEELTAEEHIDGVLDITTTTMIDEIVGGIRGAGPGRLEAACSRGIPLLVAPGACECVNFGPPETIPEKFIDRIFIRHTATTTLMRATATEMRELGAKMAEKLNRARGPAALLVPLRGFSRYDEAGGPRAMDFAGNPAGTFHDPESDMAFLEGVKSTLNQERVRLMEPDLHINDEAFSKIVAEVFLSLVK
ncbi:MAG: Tm-1-like ATP-binding domain-containing protein [Nitrospinota bacterium]|jgi:uncharacterized protein (UPF0261 family)|nr:Tm-1-like ATP-binding domain-containing protein [Nitrospinota bacterium]MDP7369507.1 Tm-1-like ATP-binding domain-containing protein [Nitrospinota bacterium]MDP7502510.1 Tm-1-like ATP-binding domain-containing protein [Nitrospinota bacterium]MDP7661756.1 Tm-1-like ATP-binding domain-containing protein [Nitrospinota bacterium]HJP12982.1 Tm-1-like ATP-binding domain-containing protein [Nitrospinota bacterium]